MVRVDDRRHTRDLPHRVVDDRIHGRVADDGQVPREVLLRLCAASAKAKNDNEGTHLKDGHELLGGVRLGLPERGKANISRRQRLVREWWSERVEVVCPDRDELPAPTDVLVQLVLQVNEGFI